MAQSARKETEEFTKKAVHGKIQAPLIFYADCPIRAIAVASS